jgi:hypothetical protein
MAKKDINKPTREELMIDLVRGLHKESMLYFLIGALSSEQNVVDQQAKEASITQLQGIREALDSVPEIPETDKPKIIELIDKSIEICEQYKFE